MLDWITGVVQSIGWFVLVVIIALLILGVIVMIFEKIMDSKYKQEKLIRESERKRIGQELYRECAWVTKNTELYLGLKVISDILKTNQLLEGDRIRTDVEKAIAEYNTPVEPLVKYHDQ